MEKLLEQAQALVASLNEKNKQADGIAVELKAREGRLDARQVELDNFQADLLQRESNIKPIENISETFRQATESKAQSDLEWHKLRGEKEAFEQKKAKHYEENRIEQSAIKNSKELYERGAKENAEFKAKLDEKAKQIKAATQGV